MKLHEVARPEGSTHRRRRRGRGIAAGQGKTGGFGTKGSGARSGRGGMLAFEGGQLPLVNRLPIKRGFRNVNRVSYSVVNVADLDRFESGALVDVALLMSIGLVKDARYPVKILGEGTLTKGLLVRAHRFSATAKSKIEAAGGSVEVL
jgi:large subunit ribosomal protein L15